MTNLEKYKDEIFEVLKSTNTIAILHSGEVVPCFNTPCNQCKLHVADSSCRQIWKKWANDEYVEPKVFTDAEKAVFKACKNLQYAARDTNNVLYFYTHKPSYNISYGCWIGCEVVMATKITAESFAAIKVSDKEPTSREEILGVTEADE